MTNLLEETKRAFEKYRLKPEEIEFCTIGRKDEFEIFELADKITSWEKFSIWAEENFSNYDEGFGGAKVPNCVIVFKDKTWLSRGEYDGSEWWDFNKCPGYEDFI